MQISNKRLLPFFVLAAALALASLGALLMSLAEGNHAPPDQAAPALGGPFTLTAHTGERISRSDFAEQYRLIYFGYSYCPDVCPLELGKMARALRLLETRGAPAERVQPLFISIDPARDTPAQLADYVPAFHPRLIGLTGSADEIAAVADAYRIHYARAGAGGAVSASDDMYLMDHSSYILFMGPDGQFIEVFTARETAADIADAVADRLE